VDAARLAGLALISWLGSYPDPAAGNKGVISFGWGFIVVLAFSAVIYALALRVRLPRETVADLVLDTEREAEQEAEELPSH
jgi:hypothetical protein